MNRYLNIPITSSNSGKQIYQTSRYPEIPFSQNDTYVITTIGDRADTLAQQYYQDASLYWIICIANGLFVQDSLIFPLGSQIRIPANPSKIIQAFVNINS